MHECPDSVLQKIMLQQFCRSFTEITHIFLPHGDKKAAVRRKYIPWILSDQLRLFLALVANPKQTGQGFKILYSLISFTFDFAFFMYPIDF